MVHLITHPTNLTLADKQNFTKLLSYKTRTVVNLKRRLDGTLLVITV